MAAKIKKAQSMNAQILSGELSQSELAAALAKFVKLEAHIAKYGKYDDLVKIYEL